MIASNIIDQLTAAVAKVFPQGLTDDIQTNIKASLQSRLNSLGLVTREELEVQEALLERLRLQLTELEKKVSQLEKK